MNIIEELRSLEAAATPAPWRLDNEQAIQRARTRLRRAVRVGRFMGWTGTVAEFADIEALDNEVTRLTRLLREQEEAQP